MLQKLPTADQEGEIQLLREIMEIISRHVADRDNTGKAVQNHIHPDKLRSILRFDDIDILNHQQLLELCSALLENSTQTQHPYFVSQLYGRADCIGLAAEMIISALNTNVHIYDLAPVLTLVERSVIDYLGKKFIFSRPGQKSDGIFTPGASTGTQYALYLARHNACPDIKRFGDRAGGPLVAFCSEAAHYSCVNSAMLLGLGSENMRKIPCDENGVMHVDQLKVAIKEARDASKIPFCVIATSGTTVLGGFDPISEIADIADSNDMWLHVDAAWGGAAIFSGSHKSLMQGVERADSLVFNAHKMLGLPIQCSALLVNGRHNGLLTEAVSIHAPYLHQSERETYENDLDISKKTFQCGRKGDALKFWLFKKAFGEVGLEERVERCCHVTKVLTEKLLERQRRDGSFVLKSSIFATTCFWYIPHKYRGLADPVSSIPEMAAVAPGIKEHMLAQGYNCMLGYANSGDAPAFFRWAVVNPPAGPDFAEHDIDRILDIVENVGEQM